MREVIFIKPHAFFKKNIHMLMAIVSYFALLLLGMQATIVGIVQTVVLFILGIGLIIWKKAQIQSGYPPKLSFFVAIFPVAILGERFYSQWIFSSKVSSVASALCVSSGILIIAAALFLGVLAIYSVAFMFWRAGNLLAAANEKQAFPKHLLCGIISSMEVVALSQMMIEENLLSMGPVKFFWGTMIVFIVVSVLYCLSGHSAISVTLGTAVFMVASTVNVYVYKFRGRLFEPVDILSAGTAMNVADNYNFWPIPLRTALGWATWVGILIWIWSRCAKKKFILKGKKRAALAAGCLAGVMLVAVYTGNLETYHWDKKGATYNGFILDFVSKFKETFIAKPDGYSEENIHKLSERYALNTEQLETGEKHPHIIVIMNESFSDLSVLGELTTNMEVMPFISSLEQNVVSGYALSSVYGGNTANSEYEFLTGNSMAWLSPNTVPYQQYIRSPAYSMVSYLKGYYGYRCVAMHPFLSRGWNRPNAYQYLGFDESLFVESFPQEDYVRQYISDREMFEEIVRIYEDSHEKTLFLFGVSMQNHGDYTYQGENYSQSISLVGYDTEHPDAEQYLSLIHETDKAVAYLLSYFEGVDEDVVVVFFGDHQPRLSETFYETMGDEPGSLDAYQKRYMVPFFIWANYDINEKSVACTSFNYLSSYVYEAAGLSLPPYNQFLSEMEKNISAINANGFYSLGSQCYLPLDLASEKEREWLELYKQLQYNNIFDEEFRNREFFPTLE